MLIYVCLASESDAGVLVVFLVVCYSLFCFLLLLFSSAILRAKGAESIVYLTYIYRISIVFDSRLSATLLLFDS